MRHGFLLIDKPTGPTSHGVVSQIRRSLHEPSVGHLGTLDPAASGLLVLAIGAKALKVIEFFQDLSKEYEASIRFGAVSSTYDREGAIEAVKPKPGWQVPDELKLRRIIEDRLTGDIAQIPPAFSAIHIDGKRAHELARRGNYVHLPARPVHIEKCDILTYEFPHLSLRIACGSGTYIRSLAHDLGQLSGFGAYLDNLRRTRVGGWRIEDAHSPESAAWGDVIPLKDVLSAFNAIEVTDGEEKDIRCGKNIQREVKAETFAWHDGLPIAVLVPSKDGSRTAHPRKVL